MLQGKINFANTYYQYLQLDFAVFLAILALREQQLVLREEIFCS